MSLFSDKIILNCSVVYFCTTIQYYNIFKLLKLSCNKNTYLITEYLILILIILRIIYVYIFDTCGKYSDGDLVPMDPPLLGYVPNRNYGTKS